MGFCFQESDLDAFGSKLSVRSLVCQRISVELMLLQYAASKFRSVLRVPPTRSQHDAWQTPTCSVVKLFDDFVSGGESRWRFRLHRGHYRKYSWGRVRHRCDSAAVAGASGSYKGCRFECLDVLAVAFLYGGRWAFLNTKAMSPPSAPEAFKPPCCPSFQSISLPIPNNTNGQ